MRLESSFELTRIDTGHLLHLLGIFGFALFLKASNISARKGGSCKHMGFLEGSLKCSCRRFLEGLLTDILQRLSQTPWRKEFLEVLKGDGLRRCLEGKNTHSERRREGPWFVCLCHPWTLSTWLCLILGSSCYLQFGILDLRLVFVAYRTLARSVLLMVEIRFGLTCLLTVENWFGLLYSRVPPIRKLDLVFVSLRLPHRN